MLARRVPALVSWSCCMLARLVLGAVTARAMVVPALAGMMNADEARKFVAGKVFAFTCFDGTRGAGRVLDDLGAAGSIQFSGAGPIRHVRLPGNTLQIRGQAVCASIKGLPFEPCFNLDKRDDRSLPRIGVGHGLRLLRFPSPGRAADADGPLGGAAALAACAGAPTRSADASRAEVSARVETPAVESAKLEPVKSEPRRSRRSRSAPKSTLRRVAVPLPPSDRATGDPMRSPKLGKSARSHTGWRNSCPGSEFSSTVTANDRPGAAHTEINYAAVFFSDQQRSLRWRVRPGLRIRKPRSRLGRDDQGVRQPARQHFAQHEAECRMADGNAGRDQEAGVQDSPRGGIRHS